MGDVPLEVFFIFWGIACLITIPICYVGILICQIFLSLFVDLNVLLWSAFSGMFIGWFVAFNFTMDIRGV